MRFSTEKGIVDLKHVPSAQAKSSAKVKILRQRVYAKILGKALSESAWPKMYVKVLPKGLLSIALGQSSRTKP